jgi:hypothetical protein
LKSRLQAAFVFLLSDFILSLLFNKSIRHTDKLSWYKETAHMLPRASAMKKPPAFLTSVFCVSIMEIVYFLCAQKKSPDSGDFCGGAGGIRTHVRFHAN